MEVEGFSGERVGVRDILKESGDIGPRCGDKVLFCYSTRQPDSCVRPIVYTVASTTWSSMLDYMTQRIAALGK